MRHCVCSSTFACVFYDRLCDSFRSLKSDLPLMDFILNLTFVFGQVDGYFLKKY